MYKFFHYASEDTVAERLRRLTRNQLGLSRVGSSPAGVENFFFVLTRFYFFIVFSNKFGNYYTQQAKHLVAS